MKPHLYPAYIGRPTGNHRVTVTVLTSVRRTVLAVACRNLPKNRALSAPCDFTLEPRRMIAEYSRKGVNCR